jgi:uncharacterized protein YlxP (DUF503 family)
MFVGVLRLTLHVPGARSLKDRRAVVRSFRDRIAARFDVSIAEVGDLETPTRATLGVAVVSNDRTLCDRILSDVAHAAGLLRDAVLTDRAVEFVPFGAGGASIRNDLGPSFLDDATTEDPRSARQLPASSPYPSVRPTNLWSDDEDA